MFLVPDSSSGSFNEHHWRVFGKVCARCNLSGPACVVVKDTNLAAVAAAVRVRVAAAVVRLGQRLVQDLREVRPALGTRVQRLLCNGKIFISFRKNIYFNIKC